MNVTWLTDSMAPRHDDGSEAPDSPVKSAVYFLPANGSPVTLR